MRTEFISFDEAKQGAHQALSLALSALDIHPTVPFLDERYAENDVCWIFFRNRAIPITHEEASKRSDLISAFAVTKWGGMLYVADNFDDEQKLEVQMLRFALIHPGLRPREFWQVFGRQIRYWNEKWRVNKDNLKGLAAKYANEALTPPSGVEYNVFGTREVYITRKGHWNDEIGPEITQADWEAYVKSDPEMQLADSVALEQRAFKWAPAER